jgi:putative transposase
MAELPRKERRTFNEPGHAHYLTFSCFHGLPLLSTDRTCRWLMDTIEHARVAQEIDLYACVFMPEHVHLLVWPRRREYSIERFRSAVKRPVSFKAKRFLVERSEMEWLARLTVRYGRQEYFHFWQAGGGFDRNLTRRESLWPVVEYIHANPVRRGLVERPADWPWSSARFWLDGSGLLRMDKIPY